ncbi:alpha/beta fold hydrolase [Natronorarus salvus]|uniref:alpha/beta fold hydrolase n=1 Tax=Natronorarus salvus TaxID=3117733 RepID=UPI002F263214
MNTVTHEGRTIAYEVHDRGGDGPGAVFVHGSGGSRAVWKSQARLADEFPVVTLDLSGHGESEDVGSDPGWETLSAYASDVIAVAEETAARTLVGNSLGGAVCLHVALHRRFEPERLVLAGTGARLAVLEDLREWLETDFERAVEFLHEPGHFLSDGTEDRLVRASREAMLDCGQAVVRRDFESCHRFDVREELSGIDVPSLAVCGSADRLTPPSYHRYLAEEMPDCEYEEIDGAAHLAMLDRPDEFNATLSEFLGTQ